MGGYTLHLDDGEIQSLVWIADRYRSARVLFDALTLSADAPPREGGERTYTLPEHAAWSYLDALPEDGGDDHALLPPCCGGSLAVKLLDLYAEVV